MRGDHFIRQWRLVRLVSRSSGVTVAAGARELACSVRTVWRDLSALHEAGLPIYSDGDDGRESVWRVHASFHDRLPFPITLDEVVGLVLSERLLAPAHLSPVGASVASLVGKLRALLAPSALALIDRMAERVGVRALGAKLQAGALEHLPVIERALADRRALHVRYYSMSRAAESERRIDPYHLTQWNGGLYLIGHCHLRQAVRIFAVERMRSVELDAATFDAPGDFDVEAYLESAWGLIRGELVTVVARFAPTVAPYIRERVWHESQQLRDLAGDGLEMTVRVADTIEVRRWLLGFGTEAEVVAPPSLRDAIRREAGALAARLAPPSDGEPAGGRRRPLARTDRRSGLPEGTRRSTPAQRAGVLRRASGTAPAASTRRATPG